MMIINGLCKVFEVILDTAEDQFLDEKPLLSRLMEISALLDNGIITQKEYDDEETAILTRLKEIRQYIKDKYYQDDNPNNDGHENDDGEEYEE